MTSYTSINIKDYYEKKAPLEAQMSPIYQQEVLKKILGKLRIGIDGTCLDLGSGIGNNLNTLAIYFNKIIASDISLNALKVSKENYKLENCKYIGVDVENLPFRNCVFDVIVITEVLEHIFDLKKGTGEIYRILKNGRFVIVSTPNYHNLVGFYKKYKDKQLGKESWDPWGAHQKGFERYMTPKLIETVLKGYGFEILYREGREYGMAWFLWIDFINVGFIRTVLCKFRNLCVRFMGKGCTLPFIRGIGMNYYLLLRKS